MAHAVSEVVDCVGEWSVLEKDRQERDFGQFLTERFPVNLVFA